MKDIEKKYRRNPILLLLLNFFILIISPTLLSGQNDTISQDVKFNKKYFVSYWSDTKQIIASPFHWKGKQWLTFAGLAGVTTVVYIYDKDIYNFFKDNKTETAETISKYFIEPWGSGLYSIPLLGVIYLTGHKNSRHRNVALTGLKAFIISGASAMVAKQIFHRHRPSQADPPDPYLWEGPFNFETQYTSFPSGHTTTAFAVASVLAHGYKDKIWIGITSYSVAALVGLSRIQDGKHWASDVVAGAILGTFIGTTLSKINFKKVEINPTAFKGGYGMSVKFRL